MQTQPSGVCKIVIAHVIINDIQRVLFLDFYMILLEGNIYNSVSVSY